MSEPLCACGHKADIHAIPEPGKTRPCFRGHFGGSPCPCDDYSQSGQFEVRVDGVQCSICLRVGHPTEACLYNLTKAAPWDRP